MSIFEIYHQYDDDDSIGFSLNALQGLLEQHYRGKDELMEHKRILDQAFVDYDEVMRKLSDTNTLLERAKQTIDELTVNRI